ncbi:MAG: hypothetical protein Q4B70_10080, partial [Lachnospiraceae bacterium]|nr:hypothetical protein [Lachnospiraceae bacterium]
VLGYIEISWGYIEILGCCTGKLILFFLALDNWRASQSKIVQPCLQSYEYAAKNTVFPLTLIF